MANNWNIPDWLEKKIRHRDKTCIYCGVKFKNNNYDRASWEHIENDASKISELNIALCCRACNSSKGTKDIEDWLNAEYCKKKNITKKTVAGIVRKHINAKSRGQI